MVYEEIEKKDIERILYKCIESLERLSLDDKKSIDFTNKETNITPRLLETSFFERPHFNEYFLYGLCEVMGTNGNSQIRFEDCKVTKKLKLALMEMLKGYLEGLYGPKDIVVIGFSEKREHNGIILDCSEYNKDFMRLDSATKIDYNEDHEIYFLELRKKCLDNKMSQMSQSCEKKELEGKVFAQKQLANENYESYKSPNEDIFIGFKECSITVFLDEFFRDQDIDFLD